MIQNLNAVTFRKFGTILNPKDLPQEGEYSLLPDAARIYRTQVPTPLRCQPGQVLLSVAPEEGPFADFYLDKPLTLAPGIRFCLTPLKAPVPVTLGVPVTPCGSRTAPGDFRIRPRLRVESICTFFYQEREQGFLFPGESHTMLELTYVDQGILHSVADGRDLLLEQGDLVLYGPELWHMQYADIGVAPRFITISFEATGMDLSGLYNQKFSCGSTAKAILGQMLREQDRPDPHSDDMLLALLQQLLLTLLRQAQAPALPLQGSHSQHNESRIIDRAMRYITENVYSPLSVPLVAQAADVSTSYLTSLFHKHLQLSPGEYIRRIKLQQSKQLIREGNLNFSEIANALQYSTVHHFSRQFKEKFGITPTQYAKSLR